MRSQRFARVGITSVGFLLAAVALAGCGGGSSSQPTPDPQRKGIEAPTILSPRKGDVVGYDFTVAGTYVLTGTDVTVVVSGEVADTKSMKSLPSWTFDFGKAKKDGAETASATVPGSKSSDVSFTLKGMPDLLAVHDVENLMCDVCTGKCSFDVKVTNTNAAASPTITASLYNTTNGSSVHGPITLTKVAGTNLWKGNFPGVDKGFYGVQFKRTIGMDPPVTTSRVIEVK